MSRRVHARLLLAAGAMALAGCAALRGAPATSAGSRPGTTRYAVAALSFEAPSSWRADGDRSSVRLTEPGERGRLEVRVLDERFGSEKACLDAASATLARGDRGLQNVQRHPSRFAGRPAVAQEADQGGWHGWAWAACDGGTQYRAFFTGRSPMANDVIEAWRGFTKSASIQAR